MSGLYGAYAAPAWANAQRVGDVGTKSTLQLLASYADERYSCFPSQERIADETEQSPSTVYRQLKRLEKWGLIVRAKRYRYDEEKKKKVRASDRFFLQLDNQFRIAIHGADYDAAKSGPPRLPVTPVDLPVTEDPDLPVNVTSRSDDEVSDGCETPGRDLPVNVTGRSEDAPEDSAPTSHEAGTYQSPVTGELLARTPSSLTTPKGVVENRAHTHASTHTREGVPTDAPTRGAIDPKIQTQGPGGTGVTKRARKHRLPGDWTPSPELLEWAAQRVPGMDLVEETAEFVHYWTVEASGKSAMKVDWDRTWQNRMKDRYDSRWPRRNHLRVVPDAPAIGAELVVASEEAELAERALGWWLAEGNLVPSARRPELLGLIREAFEAGATRVDVANTLLACKHAGKACPQDWLFANVLAAVRSGAEPEVILSAAGVRLSAQQARDLGAQVSMAKLEAQGMSQLDLIKHVMKHGPMAERPGVSSDAQGYDTIDGEVAR